MSFPWKFAETKYLRILKIYGSEDFKEQEIQLPGFYTYITPSELETSAPQQLREGVPSTPTPRF